MLDLSSLIEAEDISELSPNLNAANFCNKLARCISEGKAWAQSLDSINMSYNNIATLKHLTTALLEYNVKLQNLSLSNNSIANIREVDYLVDMRLREVMLSDNPIAKKGDEYHRYVVKKLRTIELLDTISVKEWRKQLLPKLPDPCDSQMTTQANADLVHAICGSYFKCIDEGRFEDLLDAYDADAFLTHVTEPQIRVYQSVNAKSYHQTMQYRSHNLLRLDCANTKDCTKNVYRGRIAISDALRKDMYSKLRDVTHDVSKFKCDAVVLGATVVATIHGVFHYKVEGERTNFSSCFDRVFVLRPNTSGGVWPARIANDNVVIRCSQPAPIILPENDVKAKLMKETGLNEVFAALLLKESGGAYDNALHLFNQNKAQGTIPAVAFASV